MIAYWMTGSLPVFQLVSRHANYILMLLFQVRQHNIHKWSSAVFGTVRIHSARWWFKACLKNVLSGLSNHTISLPQYSICPVPTTPSHHWLGNLEHHTVQLQMPWTHENEHHAHKLFLFNIFNVTYKTNNSSLYGCCFYHYNTPIHWLIHGHMASNNETVYHLIRWAGNLVKTDVEWETIHCCKRNVDHCCMWSGRAVEDSLMLSLESQRIYKVCFFFFYHLLKWLAWSTCFAI